MKIGELVSEPKYIDEAISLVSRGRFARMCIEVDIMRPLLSKFKLRRRSSRIEYEGIHLICFKCGVYVHRDDQCQNNEEDDDGLELEKQTAASEQRSGKQGNKESPRF